MSVFEAPQEYTNLLELYEKKLGAPVDQGEDLSQEPSLIQALQEMRQEHLSGIKDQVHKLSYCVRNYESDVVGIKNAIDNMQNRLRTKKNAIKSLKEYVYSLMTEWGIKKLDLSDSRISIRKNPPSVKVYEESELPKQYFIQRTETSIDKNAIKNDIKNGQHVPGAELVQTESLLIK